jgi:hypothetical protein
MSRTGGLTFSDGFGNISVTRFGVTRHEATAAVIAPDRRERFRDVPDKEWYLAIRYYNALDGGHGILVLYDEETSQVIFAWKVYGSLLEDFFTADPNAIYDTIMRRFSMSLGEVNRLSGGPELRFVIAMKPSYDSWIASAGDTDFDRESRRIAAFGRSDIAPAIHAKPFEEQVGRVVHDFCFYCRQHPAALAALGENQVRDLFLVLVKCLFGPAAGEAYRFDGKLDFELINPGNRYEIVTGEFKKWSGRDSARRVYHQALRKHATGQEHAVFVIFLSDRRNAASVLSAAISELLAQPEGKSSTFEIVTPAGSSEHMTRCVVMIRETPVPLTLAVANLFHERL